MIAKRVFDLTFATAAAIILFPVMGLISISIFVIDRASPVFCQERVGMGGEPFTILKFRTMRRATRGVFYSSADDSRITRLGAILRRYKLDELPQLINVIAGDMSFVGPRPEVPAYVQYWPEELRNYVLSVRPGITDPASIKYRNEGDLLADAEDPDSFYREVLVPDKLRLYADYVARQSMAGDLSIIIQTLNSLRR